MKGCLFDLRWGGSTSIHYLSEWINVMEFHQCYVISSIVIDFQSWNMHEKRGLERESKRRRESKVFFMMVVRCC